MNANRPRPLHDTIVEERQATRHGKESQCTPTGRIVGVQDVFGLAGKTRDVLTPAVGSSHAAVVRVRPYSSSAGVTVCYWGEPDEGQIGQLIVGGGRSHDPAPPGHAGQQSLSTYSRARAAAVTESRGRRI